MYEQYTETKVVCARHTRILKLVVSRYSGTVFLNMGEFPVLTQIRLGNLAELPVTYYLIEQLLIMPTRYEQVALPNGTTAKLNVIQDRSRGYKAPETSVCEFRNSSTSLYQKGELTITMDDLDAVKNGLFQAWRENEDYIKNLYRWKHRPELATPPPVEGNEPTE